MKEEKATGGKGRDEKEEHKQSDAMPALRETHGGLRTMKAFALTNLATSFPRTVTDHHKRRIGRLDHPPVKRSNYFSVKLSRHSALTGHYSRTGVAHPHCGSLAALSRTVAQPEPSGSRAAGSRVP